LIDRNALGRFPHRIALLTMAVLSLAGCGGASVFTDDTLVRANEAAPVPITREAVASTQSDGYPNPQQPTAPAIARDLSQDERKDLKSELETLRDEQATVAVKDQPADRAAAIRKAAAERKKKILKEIAETDRSQ
jgi:hypothetical protein